MHRKRLVKSMQTCIRDEAPASAERRAVDLVELRDQAVRDQAPAVGCVRSLSRSHDVGA